MLVSLIKNNKIQTINLPNKYYGVYWVTDINEKNEEVNLISISSEDNNWKLNSNNDVIIVQNNEEMESITLENYHFYNIYNKVDKTTNFLYCMPTYDETFDSYYLNGKTLEIGNTNESSIFISSNVGMKISLEYVDNQKININCNGSNVGIYVNDIRINGTAVINIGDRIFISGVIIIPMCENDKPFVLVNNPNGMLKFNTTKLLKIEKQKNEAKIDDISDDDATVFAEKDYFHKKPRFRELPNILNIAIDAPPAKAQKSDMPVILVIGPMLTSSAITIIYAYITINNLVQNRQSFASAWPSFMICILSLMATLFWPLIIRKYTSYRYKKIEKQRVKSYEEYIKGTMQLVEENASLQTRILKNNNPTIMECKKAIEEKNVNFWNRKPNDEDFLNVSIGIGSLPMEINLSVPDVHFMVEKDELLENISKLKNDLPILNDVPITYNFLDKKVTAIVGNYELDKKLTDSIIFQLATFHSYDELKIVVLTDDMRMKNKNWDYMKVLPHAWSNDTSMRFIGTNKDEIREICYYLDNILQTRLNSNHDNKKNTNIPFYLIVTDNYKMVRNFEFIKKITELDNNMGFGILILNDKVFNLPAECDSFINVSEGVSEIFQNILNSQVQKFKFDYITDLEIEKYAKMLANIPVEINDSTEGNLPNKISLLELYEVGKIEQLNVLNRWKENNPMLSLQSLVGVGKGGEKIYLDLHEKYQGPHGLIAGATGSGKSEFIATYILSLAINYHPKEVEFILIDYKGGGLAGIFENKMTGIKLPHLVGTITNLDENEIARSLASIESEIKRRQIVFSEVREKLGDSVIDIYRYQQLYRDGLVDEAISHLFIISDEFAELKKDQPEFLQQLISISRIGRSLGIHLILATQKPSGVVDNQIWSNSKFRVCFRVQEKADSTEVIKTPDAAYLKDTGRFYLQVGFNEASILGQAAWAGANYVPYEKVKKKVDTNVEFINDIGYRIKNVPTTLKLDNSVNLGEESKNIIRHLYDLANQEHIEINNLWLEKLPDYININDLKNKYHFVSEPFKLDVPVGEYDIPSRQHQELLTIPFYSEGNALVYGSTGSGKENFITTMLYSMVTSYSPYEVIAYILDFGSESLNVFKGIPHIGDVLESSDQEKISNLFKLLFYMLDERKKLFAPFGGEYDLYTAKSENKVPSVVVIINGYDSYFELYPNFNDYLVQLTREGPKFGIYFVLTVINQNNLRLKLSQNFKQIFTLQQNNVADYSNILGNVGKKYPSKIFGRGIIKRDDVYEFQTAMVSEIDKIFDYIEDIKPILNNNEVKAIEIPTLPKIVTKDVIAPQLNKDGSIIVGINKEDLSISKYDLKKYYTSLFLTYDMSLVPNFIIPFIEQLKYTDSYNIIVIDADKILSNINGVAYYDYKFDKIFDDLYRYVIEKNKKYIANGNRNIETKKHKKLLCVMVGFDSFKNKLSSENQLKISELFEKGKDLDAVKYIFIDSVDKMRKYEFESWYKTVINSSRGIFIGNGITDQMLIKLVRSDASLRGDVEQSFCYVIDHGRATLVKYVENFEN